MRSRSGRKEFELIKNDAETAKGSSTKNGVDMPTETASEEIINQEGIKSQSLFEKIKNVLDKSFNPKLVNPALLNDEGETAKRYN